MFWCIVYKVGEFDIGENEFTNWIIAIGTIISSIGLVCFGIATYKNQSNNEFYSLFNVLLTEHNILLNKIDDKKLDDILQSLVSILYKYSNIYPAFKIKDSNRTIKSKLDILQEELNNINPYLNHEEIKFSQQIYHSFSNILENISDTNELLYLNPGSQQHAAYMYDDYNKKIKAIVEKFPSLEKQRKNLITTSNPNNIERDAIVSKNTIHSYIDFIENNISFLNKINEIQENQAQLLYEINFNKEKLIQAIKQEIDSKIEIKPYLIILFRLLKYVHQSKKIGDEDKKECYGLIRGLLPAKVQFLILLNSLGFQETEPNYVDLISSAKLMEHLPLTVEWLTQIQPTIFPYADKCAA